LPTVEAAIAGRSVMRGTISVSSQRNARFSALATSVS